MLTKERDTAQFAGDMEKAGSVTQLVTFSQNILYYL